MGWINRLSAGSENLSYEAVQKTEQESGTDGASAEKQETLPEDPAEIPTETTQEFLEPSDPEEISDIPAQDKIPVCAEGLTFERVSAKQIKVCWNSVSDANIESYRLERRKWSGGRDGEWIEVAQVSAEDLQTDAYSMTDDLDSAEPAQYEYRVMPEPFDTEQFEAVEGETVVASNVMICIDPGHYTGKNASPAESPYPYAEGDFTIKVAKRLSEILLEEYGIESYLTREGASITLGGYTDLALDQKHISLRGEYAAKRDSNLFLSVHTNANRDNANGSPTWEQPIAITKTLVIANLQAMDSETVIAISNAIGTNLSQVNYDYGISNLPDFDEADAGNILGWTNDYNDRPDTPGTVVCRVKDGRDSYGVLRGAGNVNIPGLIVEHGFHTVPEFRKLAAEGELQEAYARADADGIAAGYGFVSK